MPASVGARVVICWSVLWLAGCGLYGPCDHQRGIVLYATAHGGNVRQAGLESDSIIDQITAGSVETSGDDSSGSWYRATVPMEDLMQRMFRGPTYLEVRTDSVPTGAFRAPLGTPRFFLPPDDPATWQPVYCS